MIRILVIDNYDSFTYNLVQYVRELNDIEVNVVKNDRIDFPNIKKYDGLILSPGPGLPGESGKLLEVFHTDQAIPTFGVCLGLQAMAEAFGGSLRQLDKVYHGVSTKMILENGNEALFKGLPQNFMAGRYHSWVIDENSLDNVPISITCRDENGTIMAAKHTQLPISGVQFHPESVLTPEGRIIISNFINSIKKS